MDYRNLRTVKQVAESNPAFSEAALRWWIFNAESNGLNSALIRIGGRVYFDESALNAWLERQRELAEAAP